MSCISLFCTIKFNTLSNWIWLNKNGRGKANLEHGYLMCPLSLKHLPTPLLTGKSSCNHDMRDLLALPVRLGGLGLGNPCKQCSVHFRSSITVTTPLTNLILQQPHSYPADVKAQQIRAQNSTRNQRRASALLCIQHVCSLCQFV